jgi:hypothetical protein
MRWAAALVAAALLVAGCAERETASPGELRPEDLTAVERQAFIYAAAVRYLVEQGTDEPKRIYVLDRDSAGRSIPIGVQDRVREELALLGRVIFVTADHQAARAASQGKPVEDVVITLGPVPSGEDRVELRASRYRGESRSTRMLVLERHGLRWRVLSGTS